MAATTTIASSIKTPKAIKNENVVKKLSDRPRIWITVKDARKVKGTVILEMTACLSPRNSRSNINTKKIVILNSRANSLNCAVISSALFKIEVTLNWLSKSVMV